MQSLSMNKEFPVSLGHMLVLIKSLPFKTQHLSLLKKIGESTFFLNLMSLWLCEVILAALQCVTAKLLDIISVRNNIWIHSASFIVVSRYLAPECTTAYQLCNAMTEVNNNFVQ